MTDAPITAADFSHRMEAALGPNWKTVASQALAINASTMWRWSTGQLLVPAYMVAVLEFLEAMPAAFRPERWMASPPQSSPSS